MRLTFSLKSVYFSRPSAAFFFLPYVSTFTALCQFPVQYQTLKLKASLAINFGPTDT